jgi:hypothetical protein
MGVLLAGLTAELVRLKWRTSNRQTGPGVTEYLPGGLVVVYLLIGLIWELASTGVVGNPHHRVGTAAPATKSDVGPSTARHPVDFTNTAGANLKYAGRPGDCHLTAPRTVRLLRGPPISHQVDQLGRLAPGPESGTT